MPIQLVDVVVELMVPAGGLAAGDGPAPPRMTVANTSRPKTRAKIFICPPGDVNRGVTSMPRRAASMRTARRKCKPRFSTRYSEYQASLCDVWLTDQSRP